LLHRISLLMAQSGHSPHRNNLSDIGVTANIGQHGRKALTAVAALSFVTKV
jgi:hypothetical protein